MFLNGSFRNQMTVEMGLTNVVLSRTGQQTAYRINSTDLLFLTEPKNKT